MDEATTPVRPNVHHVALAVTDLDDSVRWYEEVFAVRHVLDAPHEGDIQLELFAPPPAAH